MTVPAPDWFKEAVATAGSPHRVSVTGCDIHYQTWGEAGPPLLLVHGGGAHSHWWDFIAPWLAVDHRVAAMDLSGMGESGRREQYQMDDFAGEALAVCDDAGFGPEVTLIGHSLGGAVCLRAAASRPERVGGLVMVDSPIRPPGYKFPGTARNPLSQPRRSYPDFEAALARFRLIPEQPCHNAFILDYIGRHSIMQTPGGDWTWKFDDRGMAHITVGQQAQELRDVTCRVGILYGDKSKLFPPEVREYVHQLVDRRGPVAAIPESYHHLFLDQPLAFVAALRTLLADWHAL
ncbi:MAG: alpha/beta fold hydrolase [Immundisolibacter sp.]|uniref:alpha/beta fold hydrolase n=1 Tax=Immundisolibacter sp. TaxID=1934948 RepID=UPI003EDEC48E